MATAPMAPPPLVPVAQAKDYLRIAGSEEDALLAGLLRTATELCEAFTRLALIERDVEETLPARPAWTRLALAPVKAITAVAAIGPAGEAVPLAASEHGIDIDAAGEGWVRVPGRAGRVLVRYRAGQAPDWNGVPEPLRHGILRMAAHLYAYRDAAADAAPPAAATALWLPYRRLRLT